MEAITAIKTVQQGWELDRKAELVRLGQSSKPYTEILAHLESEIENAGRMSNFDYKISCFKNDGIYQLNRAIEEIIGVSHVQAGKQPSGGGDRPMDTIDIQLADGTRKKVPYGNIELPDMGEDAIIQIGYASDAKVLHVRGKCQFKFNSLIDKIIDRTKQLLNTDSIYRNQTFEINAGVNNGQPTIIPLHNIDNELMILSEETEGALSPLKARIHHADQCKKAGIPIKFGAILEGPYGTGKTLLAFKLAKEANANNFAAIYLKSPELLADTLRMAKTLDKNGHGIIVFCEDVDQVTRGERTTALQDILNTLDGGDTKDMNVIALFTTNHLELIEPTFLRGKRIGTIISMGFLDAKTAEKYVTSFCQGIDLEGDFAPVYDLIGKSDIAPAFMAEIIENVKSTMVIRGNNSFDSTEFLGCVKSYLRQVALSRTKDSSVTKEAALAIALKDVLHDDKYYTEVREVVDSALENNN
jgi:transitional endoplasmic reticulum ATPase